MKAFLELVADDLRSKLSDDFSHVALIFPNKRAHLFFLEYLARTMQRPVWAPAALSISELFQQMSPLQTGDSIRLICELYKIFVAVTGSRETLDEFYFWGEILLSDFDDVDKNMVDTTRMFANLADLKEISDSFDFLDEEQEKAIRQFFKNFSIEHDTELKQRFTALWNKLGIIYQHFKQQLAEEGIAYEGMLYRNVIEQIVPAQLRFRKYVFIGFNALNKVEEHLFEFIRRQGKALFYWDYDLFYTSKVAGHEAGEFIRRNLKKFPNELPEALFDNFSRPKRIRCIASPTENAQARLLKEWTATFRPEGEERENAVVLCNEALLQPILYSLPDQVRDVNITMGFPLAQTPIYSLLDAVARLQLEGARPGTSQFVYQQVAAVLRHPYVQRASSHAASLLKELTEANVFFPTCSQLGKDDFLACLFVPVEKPADLLRYFRWLVKEVAQGENARGMSDKIFDQLYSESLYQCFTRVNRLCSLMESTGFDVQPKTLCKLLMRILSATNIPFHGEPILGMQIMGVLETRNLDFRNLLVLSLNEGQLPRSEQQASFIPYNLKKAFGMTTYEHKNAVYAYYFYRLLQRAEEVTLAYTVAGKNGGGEASRFVLQLLIESGHELERFSVETGQSPISVPPLSVQKSPAVLARLRQTFDSRRPGAQLISPSALNVYIDCPLKFYFHYVARLKPPVEVSAEVDSALFGSIFHRSAQLAYGEMCGQRMVTAEWLEQLEKDDLRLQRYVEQAFKEIFFKLPADGKPEYNGTQLINLRVIAAYLKRLIRVDRAYAPFLVKALEKPVEMQLTVPAAEPLTVRLGGTIDRMDLKGDTLRIIDYKTGGIPKTLANIEQLFTPSDTRPNYIFQTFVYASIVCNGEPSCKVAPSLLYIHRASSGDYSPVVQIGEPRKPKKDVDNFMPYREEFLERLTELLAEIFNKDIPFSQSDSAKKCAFCDYKQICRRK